MAIAMQTIEKQERLGKLICRAVLNALKNEENRKDFEKWYCAEELPAGTFVPMIGKDLTAVLIGDLHGLQHVLIA